MTGKIQKFIWTMRPGFYFPRTPDENDSSYIARFTTYVEDIAADCIDSINESAKEGEEFESDAREELKQLLIMASELSFSDSSIANVRLNAMKLIRYRVIASVLKIWPKSVTKSSIEHNEAVLDVLDENQANPKVISGTRNLAAFLGCGNTKAFKIISNGILEKNGIQYKVGRTWKFNTEKLEKHIAEHPDFLE